MLIKYITAFHIYALRGEDAAKMGGWRLCIKWSWNIHRWSWKNHEIVFSNFCGNTVYTISTKYHLLNDSTGHTIKGILAHSL